MAIKKSGRQSAEEAEKTKLLIITSAIKLFSEHGYSDCSLRDIAKTGGFSHGIITHHFGSKFDIWKAATDMVVASYQSKMLPAMLEAGKQNSSLNSFKHIVEAFIDTTQQHPEFVKIFAREGLCENERASYFKTHFIRIHKMMEVIFLNAQAECEKLEKFDNDSFFLTLLSLTAYPVILPVLGDFLPCAKKEESPSRKKLILELLF